MVLSVWSLLVDVRTLRSIRIQYPVREPNLWTTSWRERTALHQVYCVRATKR